MTQEDALLFACLRQDLAPSAAAIISGLAARARGALDWERVAATAERHGVAPLVGRNLAAAGADVPPAIAARFERALFENAAYKAREARRLADAVERLAASDYEVMILKGAALDRRVYDEPWMTVSRDLDLVVRPRDGAEPGEAGRQVRHSLYLSGVECDLGEHHDVTMGGVLPVPFARVWADARPLAIGGREALVMAPEDLILSLAVNACRKRYFRLKALLDLSEALGRLAPDGARLAARAREWSCEGIAYAALAAVAATLGRQPPAGTLAGLGVAPARARLLRLLIAGLLRAGSLASLAGDGRGPFLGRRFEPSLLLVYASLSPRQAAASLAGAFTHLPPELRRSRAAASAARGPAARPPAARPWRRGRPRTAPGIPAPPPR